MHALFVIFSISWWFFLQRPTLPIKARKFNKQSKIEFSTEGVKRALRYLSHKSKILCNQTKISEISKLGEGRLTQGYTWVRPRSSCSSFNPIMCTVDGSHSIIMFFIQNRHGWLRKISKTYFHQAKSVEIVRRGFHSQHMWFMFGAHENATRKFHKFPPRNENRGFNLQGQRNPSIAKMCLQ